MDSTFACLIHYHEIGLKGKNRTHFEQLLMRNVGFALRSVVGEGLKRVSGHLLATFKSNEAALQAYELIAAVPGVARVSLVYRVEPTIEAACEYALKALEEVGEFTTFKVHAKKSNTKFEMHTLDINRAVGEVLCQAFSQHKVDVHNPNVQVEVHFSEDACYVWATSKRAVGGLPVGSAGKVISLFSSGFDSPVASWMMGRRGAVVIPIHFSGRPQVAAMSEELCIDLCHALGPEGAIGRLYVAPIGDLQAEIAVRVPDKLRIIMYRRLMLSVARELARIEGAKALVTGESLGQVASQTLENITACADVVCHLPILRPLIGSDKTEIIDRARELGTYAISEQGAPDCCTLFMPKHPETKANLAEVDRVWDSLDPTSFIERAMETLEYIDTEKSRAYKPPKKFYRLHKELSLA